MRTVDVDLNFILLIMMLAIVLLGAITGFNVGKMACDKSGAGLIVWQGLFLFLTMVLLALALLYPYMVYWIGHAAATLAGMKIAYFIYMYIFSPEAILGVGASMMTGEIISTLLILASGIILIKNNPKL